DGDVRLWRGAPARDVVELYADDGAIAEGAIEGPLDPRHSRGMRRILRLTGDDHAFEQLDVVVRAEHALVDQPVILGDGVSRDTPGWLHRPSHRRALHLQRVLHNAWSRTVAVHQASAGSYPGHSRTGSAG